MEDLYAQTRRRAFAIVNVIYNPEDIRMKDTICKYIADQVEKQYAMRSTTCTIEQLELFRNDHSHVVGLAYMKKLAEDMTGFVFEIKDKKICITSTQINKNE